MSRKEQGFNFERSVRSRSYIMILPSMILPTGLQPERVNVQSTNPMEVFYLIVDVPLAGSRLFQPESFDRDVQSAIGW